MNANVEIKKSVLYTLQEESYRFAELIAHEKVKSVVINMEHAAFDVLSL